MKSKLIFILWLLMFSFFSCDFGIKENEETNSKEYFTVKGSCSIQGAIPSDLFPEKSIKQNAQRTVVPEIEIYEITVSFESETGKTKSAEVVNNNGVLNFEIELPAGKWTVKAQGKISDDVIIESESCQIELSAENESANVTLVLKPTQSDTGKGFFEFSFGMETSKVFGMKYTYEKHGATESKSAIIVNFSDPINIELSSGVYTFRFDFYSDNDELLYSFTEVVNIFDGLTTDTWIGAGEYINEGEICITDNLISQFISTTVYVSTAGDDSNLGTFFAPVNTIQKAVDKVIAMNEVTASTEENPYKILLLSDIETPLNNSFENNKALVNIDPSSASSNGNPLYLTISKYGDGNATINAKNTGRVMYIGENANVTLQNLILTGGYLKDTNGAGLYILNNAKVKIENSEISGNQAKDGGGLYLCPNAYDNDNGGNLLELSNCTISGNTATSSGGGILFCPTHNSNDDKITTLNLTNCTISSNTATQMGGGIYSYGKNPKVILDACYITNNSLGYESYNGNAFGGGLCIENGSVKMKGGSISKNKCSSDTSSFGGGVYVSDGTFSMEGDAVVDSSNDVYLKTGKTITISGELTFNGSVATITPEKYAKNSAEDVDVKVLDASEGITLSEQVGKFNVTKYNNNNNVETTITDKGFLKNTLTLGENPELTEDLYNICSTINVSTAEGMKALSTLSPPENAENPGQTFKGKTIILKNNVVLDDEYKPIHTFSGVFDGGGCSIEIMAPTIYDWDSPKGKALFYVVTGENAEIKNLIVKGTAEGAGIAYELTEKAKISNCKSWVNITTKGNGYPTPGGIVSNLNNGSRIENCENYGTIICNKKNTGGGIVGDMSFYTRDGEGNCTDYTVIANCTNYGDVIIEDVTGVVKMGGICGDFSFGTIFNCANKGEVNITATTNNEIEILGGIVGFCCGEKIDGIINCYNSGKIHSSSKPADQNIGGIVGEGYVGLYNNVYYTIRVINTVNNDDATYCIGNIEFYADSDDFDKTNNFYKKSGESSFDNNNIDSVVNTLNDYSDNSGGKYLTWDKDSNGNIIFSKDISDNQESTP